MAIERLRVGHHPSENTKRDTVYKCVCVRERDAMKSRHPYGGKQPGRDLPDRHVVETEHEKMKRSGDLR